MGDYQKTIVTYVGATGRTLTFNIKQSGGTAYDLTGLSCTLSARVGDASGTVVIDAQAMTISDDSGGVVTYKPTSDELTTDQKLLAQIMITNGGENDFTRPFWIDIQKAVVGST